MIRLPRLARARGKRTSRDYDHECNSDRVFTGFAAVLASVVGTMALASAFAEVVAVAAPTPDDRPSLYRQVKVPRTPCVAADGPPPCFWDAGVRGNGRGNSFWLDKHGHVVYLDPRVREPYGGCDEQPQPGNRRLPECSAWWPSSDVDG